MNFFKTIFLILTVALATQNIQAMKRERDGKAQSGSNKRARNEQQSSQENQRSGETPPCYLSMLPTDVLVNIILYSLNNNDLHTVMQSCKFMNQPTADAALLHLAQEMNIFIHQNYIQEIQRIISKIIMLAKILRKAGVQCSENFQNIINGLQKKLIDLENPNIPLLNGACLLNNVSVNKILEHLDLKDLLTCSQICKAFNITTDEHIKNASNVPQNRICTIMDLTPAVKEGRCLRRALVVAQQTFHKLKPSTEFMSGLSVILLGLFKEMIKKIDFFSTSNQKILVDTAIKAAYQGIQISKLNASNFGDIFKLLLQKKLISDDEAYQVALDIAPLNPVAALLTFELLKQKN